MNIVIFHNNSKFTEYSYGSEDDFEQLMFKNSKLLFGSSTIYINLKTKIDTASLGSSKPDGLLFDLSNIDSPEFYLVEVELAKHDFYRHIFPQITRFFAFFRNSKAQNGLIENIFTLVQSDKELDKQFKFFLKGKETFKFIKDTVENSQNILLVIDDMKPELTEMINTYTEWSKMVRLLVLKEFRNDTDKLMVLSPDFEGVALTEEITESKGEEENSNRIKPTEEYHLEGVDPLVKDIYQRIKSNLLSYKSSLRFNPQKYYISIVDKKNFAYMIFRKKKIWITLLLKESLIWESLKYHKVVTESAGVQKFYGGECASIAVENDSNLDEVTDLLKKAITKESNTS
jgi:predicted transport protein